MTPHLTDEQRHALQEASGTGPVSVDDPATHTTYILVRADLYEQGHLAFADDTVNPRGAYPFVDQVLRADDALDPLLDGYQRLASLPRA